jgi:hypothetical protein
MPLHSPISLGFWALETTLSLERKAAAGMLVKIRVKRLAVVEKRKTLSILPEKICRNFDLGG